jgi:nucleoside-diphosphate-sugar epimerase
MSSELHTILGASGAIGRAVIKELQNRKLAIRLVGRSLKIEGIEIMQADLLNSSETKKAIQDSTHVYLCVGIPYRTDVWLKNWPLLMQNVIAACVDANAILIFFDNIYMYGAPPLTIPFDENHPQNPTTQKGIARKQTADLLLKSIKENKLTAVIGRSADFYGPSAANSPFFISFLERMLKNKAPQYLSKPGIKHTYANCMDNGKALVAIALDPTTYGQVWHLPVGEPITIEEVAAIFNKELGTNFKISFLPAIVRKILSLFISPIKEASEMLYQFNDEYIMSFDKFKKHFPNFKVTSYEEGISEMINSFKGNSSLKSNL